MKLERGRRICRVFLLLLLFLFVISIFNSIIVLGQEESSPVDSSFFTDDEPTNPTLDNPLETPSTEPPKIPDKAPGFFKDALDAALGFVKPAYGFVIEKLNWVLGVGTFSGEAKHIGSWTYWKPFTGFLWYYALFSLTIFVIMFVFYLIQHSFSGFEFEFFLPDHKYRIRWLIAYPFLMGVPVINRILDVLTLEITGAAFIWRALVVATVFYFLPSLWEGYVKSRLRNRLYKEKLKKAAGEEIMKVHLKR